MNKMCFLGGRPTGAKVPMQKHVCAHSGVCVSSLIHAWQCVLQPLESWHAAVGAPGLCRSLIHLHTCLSR
jgi:hypothetical protein